MENIKENEVNEQHDMIKIKKNDAQTGMRNPDPAAAWFPEAGLGLFIHWGISTVKATLDLSWGMICGWEFASKDATEYEISEMNKPLSKRVIGKHFTPNMYFSLAEQFKGENFSADDIIQRAKDAGFKYAVFTTRHHDGFAMWPSKYGNFNTGNYLGGRDFVREFSDACEKHGIRKGFYYSPPDWYFNRDYMSFLVSTAKKRNPSLPDLDADYNPTVLPDEKKTKEHNLLFGKYVFGQIDELLLNYGKVDVLWFDGTMPDGLIYPLEKIRALQPGIVVNPRMHGTADFETKEVKEAETKPDGWWEFCTQWMSRGWAYMHDVPYRPLSEISAEYVRTVARGGNYLLNIGPVSDGTLPATAEEKLAEFKLWRAKNREGLDGITPLSETVKCNYPAVKKNGRFYVYVLPEKPVDIIITGLVGRFVAEILDSGDKPEIITDDVELVIKRPCVALDEGVRIVRLSPCE